MSEKITHQGVEIVFDKGAYITGHQEPARCLSCGETKDLRFGYCFSCACAGELRAAKRTWTQHLLYATWSLCRGYHTDARFGYRWAWERLTQTGDYKPGGYLDKEHGTAWRETGRSYIREAIQAITRRGRR